MEFRRRLYRRGSSFETTVPMPLLLTLDPTRAHDVLFAFDPESKQWVVRFEPREESERQANDRRGKKKRRGDAS